MKSSNRNREIIDESDVFVDVHRAIRRMAPAPQTRVPRGKVVTDTSRPSEEQVEADANGDGLHRSQSAEPRKASIPELGTSPKVSTFLMRRRSSGSTPHKAGKDDRITLRSDDPDLKQHLKHLGPSNAANRPKNTRINTVKIKPGIPSTIPENRPQPADGTASTPLHAPQGGVGEGLLDNAGLEASDGAHTVARGYGTMTPGADRLSLKSPSNKQKDAATSPRESPTSAPAEPNETTKLIVDESAMSSSQTNLLTGSHDQARDRSRQRSRSVSTIASLPEQRSRSPTPPKKRNTARSGSISENIVDVNGVRKVVLETTSSDSGDADAQSEDKPLLSQSQTDGAQDSRKTGASSPDSEAAGDGDGDGDKDKSKKKKRKKRGKKKTGGEAGASGSESQPLLGGGGGGQGS